MHKYLHSLCRRLSSRPGLVFAAVALALWNGCVPPQPDPNATTPPGQNGDDVVPTPVRTGSLSGRLIVQTDQATSSLGPGPVVPLADAFDAESGTDALDLGLGVFKSYSVATQRSVPATPALTGASAPISSGEILVTFSDGCTADERETLLADAGMSLIECSPCGVCRAVPAGVPAEDKSLRLRRAVEAGTSLEASPGVRSVESNSRRYIARAPNDEYYPYQWHYTMIHLPEAWDMTVGSDDVIVAVVDTGILSRHPDLQGRIIAGYDFISDAASARDGDGRDPDPEDEGDLFGGPGQSSFHGAHVSGTIAAATNNAVGVSGGTWQTRIMPLRALGVDGGTAFDVAEAIRYAAGLPNVTGRLPERRADIINLSLVGMPGETPASIELRAIQEAAAAGVIIVGAAGNDRSSLPAYPAAAPEVISVSAVDIQLQLAGYSNYGSTIDLAAPGGVTGTDLNGDGFGDGVLSTGANDRGGVITYQYVFANGTSMAAPHVSAVAALVLAANPALSAAEVRDVLQTTARDLGTSGRDDSFGRGLVDAAAAVREAYRRAGTMPPAVVPRLSVSNDTINFGFDRDVFPVQVTNTAGQLTIESVTTRTFSGSGWLHAIASPVATGASSTTVTITVNRTGLSNGAYSGDVTVAAAGLDAVSINVLMTVGLAGQSGEIIYVLAVDPGTRDTIGESATRAALNYAYTVRDLAAGSYVLYAGTDRNDDGYICEDGDLCGALPSRLEPATLALGEGVHLTGLDFSVARLEVQQQAASPIPIAPLRRLGK